jgi:hypothetical protein
MKSSKLYYNKLLGFWHLSNCGQRAQDGEEEYFTSKSKKERERVGGLKNLFDFFNFAVHKILHVST